MIISLNIRSIRSSRKNATKCGCELLMGAMGVSPRSAYLIGWVMLSFTPDHPDCFGRACCLARCFLSGFITSARQVTQPFFTFDGQVCDSAVSRSTLGIAPPKALVSHRVPFCTPCCCVPSPLHAQVSCLNRRSSGKSTQAAFMIGRSAFVFLALVRLSLELVRCR